MVAPTRELSQQIWYVIQQIGEFKEAKVHACCGGTAVREDIKVLKEGVHIVVGTPGRVLDMMKKGFLKTDYMKIFVMDEADEMLSRGFLTQIQDLFRYIPGEAQIALFSATLPYEALKLTKNFMKDPAQIFVKKEDLTLEGIKQYYIAVDKEFLLSKLFTPIIQCKLKNFRYGTTRLDDGQESDPGRKNRR